MGELFGNGCVGGNWKDRIKASCDKKDGARRMELKGTKKGRKEARKKKRKKSKENEKEGVV